MALSGVEVLMDIRSGLLIGSVLLLASFVPAGAGEQPEGKQGSLQSGGPVLKIGESDIPQEKRLGGNPWVNNAIDKLKKDTVRREKAEAMVNEAAAREKAEADQVRAAAEFDWIVIPKLELNNADAMAALSFLQDAVPTNAPPGKQLCQIVMMVSKEDSGRQITIRATNIPIMQAVRAVASAADLRWKIEGTLVKIYSKPPEATAVPTKPDSP